MSDDHAAIGSGLEDWACVVIATSIVAAISYLLQSALSLWHQHSSRVVLYHLNIATMGQQAILLAAISVLLRLDE